MTFMWGYSDFTDLLERRPLLENGVVVDTNVLISATYDFDIFFERTTELLDILIENKIPLYCNVNVRAEFLEIHRRIIFTEALLSFEAETSRASLSLDLSRKLSSLRSNQRAREKEGRAPVRLSEADIKRFKLLMLRERGSAGNLWRTLCRDFVGGQLAGIWTDTVEKVGLNFLSLRQEDQDNYMSSSPDWERAVALMGNEGISSSDAMILNMFQSSKFDAILSSDADIGISVSGLNRIDKICVLPDTIVKSLKMVSL